MCDESINPTNENECILLIEMNTTEWKELLKESLIHRELISHPIVPGEMETSFYNPLEIDSYEYQLTLLDVLGPNLTLKSYRTVYENTGVSVEQYQAAEKTVSVIKEIYSAIHIALER
ncbi:hypothetical protein OM416_19820 [Paenibacillus sp. LS1]|uniref:hypothetical protein n=1 Tax=Paenibacillus sp. LS1 TaxID=2992120 RepID=UPI00222E2216|nr:hypothetical protein [Paenibacillus sp. LS1]MCW3793844.1 hypothetical protein [Paenibacillus sp. LS1]